MHRWFHPNLSNVEAERLLLERGQDGSFLVRPSKSSAGHFSLSVRRRDKVTHIKIRRVGEFYDLHGGEQFATLAELVQFYSENQFKEKNGEILELKRPLNSSDPTTERWFHGSLSGIEAERLIREKGVNGSFLVRESQSKIGDYVLTVRTKDEISQADKVTHVIIRHHNNKYDVGGGERFNSLTELVDHYKRNPMVETTGNVVNMKYPFNATTITAQDIEARVNELSKENPLSNGKEGFWEEFEHIQHQECKVLFNRKIGQEDKNMSKNRYRNILPYDYTRVILNKPSSVTSSSSSTSTSTSTLTTLSPGMALISHLSKTNSNNNNYENNVQNNLNHNNTPQLSLNNNVLSDNTQLGHGQNNPINHGNSGITKTMTRSDDSDDDYINANYIKLVDEGTTISPHTKPLPNSKVYIATQGPLPNTVNDFWWMVWQEKSDCIVMVTKEIERGKNKCYRYWPTVEQKLLQCGPIQVINVGEVQKRALDEEYTLREFELRFKGTDENNDCRTARRVLHYQYHAWPDQHTPASPGSILEFLEGINQVRPSSPMIVHCSAGIGRSGALIVIDMLIDQLKYYGLTYGIDIQRVVKVARAQRSGLVQTEAQYKFIYLAIQHFVASLKQQ